MNLRLCIFLLCLTFSQSVFAQEETTPAPYSDFFNGDFVEVSFRYGLSKVIDEPTETFLSPTEGEMFEIGLRQALPMHLLDTRIALSFENFAVGSEENIQLYGANITTALHPFYIALLFENWFAWVLASIYLEAGIGGHYGSYADENDIGFSYSLGAGFDLPLWNPNHGWSIWLNGLYRYRGLDFDLPEREINLHNHSGIVGVSIRWNGLLF